MRKFAVPDTFILGSYQKIDPLTLQKEWVLPEPKYYAEHKYKKKVEKVPVYQGISASLARYYRSQMRRIQKGYERLAPNE